MGSSLLNYLLVFHRNGTSAERLHGCGKGDPRWQQIDGQYARIERAMIANGAKLLFAVYAPDFEVHTLNGEVTSFKESVAYSTAGFEQVKENLSISNTLLNVKACGLAVLKVTVLQQWSRRQMSHGKLRLYQTVTVQDETWALMEGEWKRKLVENLRPGPWLVDFKRVDPTKPYDPNATAFDPHGLLRGTGHSN
jgi:hypothetical protein